MVTGSTIMIIGVVQASFFIALLLTKKPKSQSDFLLISYFLMIALHLAYYYMAFHPSERLSTEVGVIGFSLVILHTPFFFLYVRSLVLKDRIRFSTILLHVLPYAAYNTVILAAYYLKFVELDPKFGFLGLTWSKYQIFYHHGILLAIIAVSYIGWGFYLLRIYSRRLLENVSNLEHTTWLRFLVLSFLFYFLAIYITIELSDSGYGFLPRGVTFYIISFILMTYVMLIGYIGLKQSSVFIQFPEERINSTESKKYAKSGVDEKGLVLLKSELNAKMSLGKYYLDTDLTLASFAAKIDLNPTYVSQVINQGFGVNFYDFINKFRVEAAKEMLLSSDNDHLSFLGIALSCGFKSKSTFNKSFKKNTGKTPSQFKLKE